MCANIHIRHLWPCESAITASKHLSICGLRGAASSRTVSLVLKKYGFCCILILRASIPDNLWFFHNYRFPDWKRRQGLGLWGCDLLTRDSRAMIALFSRSSTNISFVFSRSSTMFAPKLPHFLRGGHYCFLHEALGFCGHSMRLRLSSEDLFRQKIHRARRHVACRRHRAESSSLGGQDSPPKIFQSVVDVSNPVKRRRP
jgi:hypothetical protein